MFLYKRGVELEFKELARQHYEGLISGTKRRLKQNRAMRGSSINFFNDLSADDHQLVKKILLGDLVDLQKVINDVKANLNSGRYPALQRTNKKGKLVLTAFGKRIQRIFNYEAFSNKNSLTYNAFILAEKLGIDVCPYCNRGYTFTINSDQKIARPEFDHFLSQSDYPYLSLSFYNLIPSCHICNSNLKHNKKFTLDEFVHPYRDSLNDIIKFSVELKDKEKIPPENLKKSFGISFFYGDLKSFNVIIKYNEKDEPSAIRLKNRAVNNLKIFKIIEVYQKHKDLVVDMIINAILYDEDYINTLLESFGGTLFRNREDLIRHITKNYPSPVDMPKRAFSKLTRDIHEEFGLI